ncbi:hypothetical protein LTR78_009080 [Recurvomyces mirabilis]|uniref:Uncharacterized protein n=1 Tax=Recurvomyces mirabilis TaxID=574656 RepID=A0AAE0TP99_9PEZI|nr:hypothetical protein LTR78_009080 [Recurvomyces mirabilis]KAK5161018.1 hypothetical protein LTS14_000812 [Recurvomyces mirabilis]
MVFFHDTPIFSTGDKPLDRILAGATILAILLSLANVAGHLKAVFAARCKHGQKRTGQAIGFLGLALSSFVIVAYLRFEHHDTRIGNLQDIERLREEWSIVPILGKERQGLGGAAISNIKDGVASATEQIRPLERVTEGVKEAFDSGATAASHAASAIHTTGERLRKTSFDDATEAMKRQWHRATEHLYYKTKKAAQEAADRAEHQTQGVRQWFDDGMSALSKLAEDDEEGRLALKQKFPFLDELLYPNMSLWDSFKTVIGCHRHLWWTQQWFAGYLTWALFVGLECQHRGFQSHLALSLVVIGYTISLATAQSLFFALLLVTPVGANRKGRARRLAHIWAIAVPVVFEMVILARIPGLAVDQTKSGRMFIKDVIQFLVAVIPAISAEILHVWTPRRALLRHEPYLNASELRHALTLVWWFAGMLSLVLHLNTTYWAYRETNPTGGHRWWNILLSRSSWFAKPKTHFLHSLGTVLGSLGEHAWLNAIGWDVIFSAASLCGWAWVSAADIGGIIKCSLVPFDVLKLATTASDKARDLAEPSLEIASEAYSDMRKRMEPYANTTGDFFFDLRDAAEPYLDQSKEWLEDAGANLGSSMERNGFTADRFADQAKQSLSSGYSALSRASSRTLGRASENSDNQDWAGEEDFDALPQLTSRRGRRSDSVRGDDQGKEDGPRLRRRSSQSPAKRGRLRGNSKSRSSQFEISTRKLSGRSQSRARESEQDGSGATRRSSRSRRALDNELLKSKKQEASRGFVGSRVSSAMSHSADELVRGLRDNLPWSHDLGINEIDPEDAEATGLTFTLFVLGGLGLASAGVFGAAQTR